MKKVDKYSYMPGNGGGGDDNDDGKTQGE